jgi:threonine synthase
VLVATAHPAKFSEIVEPIVGRTIAVPAALADLLQLPRRVTAIEGTLASFAKAMQDCAPHPCSTH